MLNQSSEERNRVCDRYEAVFLKRGLDLFEIKDAKRLGCWCKPKRCHGDFLKRLIDERISWDV